MGNVVINRTLNEIMEMKEYYHPFVTEKIPPGSIFAAKTSSCTITAYKSGKVLFQGNGSEAEAGKWGSSPVAAGKKKTVKTKTPKGELPDGIGQMSVIGSDEVGTGDFFGPITVVAAYVKRSDIPILKELGVRDSKELNDEKIIAIAKEIKHIIPFSLLTLKNEKYNQAQQSGMSQGKMKAILHNKAIANVLEKISPQKPEAVLIDQFVQSGTYFQHVKSQKPVIKDNVFFSTKAEGIHLSVAAASILARYAFLQYMDQLSAAAGFKIPKGAGTQVDEAAARLILKKGKESLPSFVKLHFANTEKAFAIVRKKRN